MISLPFKQGARGPVGESGSPGLQGTPVSQAKLQCLLRYAINSVIQKAVHCTTELNSNS